MYCWVTTHVIFKMDSKAYITGNSSRNPTCLCTAGSLAVLNAQTLSQHSASVTHASHVGFKTVLWFIITRSSIWVNNPNVSALRHSLALLHACICTATVIICDLCMDYMQSTCGQKDYLDPDWTARFLPAPFLFRHLRLSGTALQDPIVLLRQQ